ncbi:MAG: trigger factor [Candidatus Gracilibacteria bacterium]
MIVEKKQLSPVEVELTIKENSKAFGEYIKKAIDAARTNASIKGFRKGSHIPDDVVLAQVGAQTIQSEALNIFLDKEYQKALRKADVTPSAAGEIQAVVSIDPLEIKLVVETTPVALLDADKVKAVKVEMKSVDVTDADIDAEIKAIEDRFTHFHDAHGHSEDGFEASSEVAEQGDRVTLSCQGYEAKDGKALTETKVDHFPLVIGSNSFIPGFEENLVAHAVGDKFGFDIVFPQEYHSDEYKGRKVYFEVSIEQIEKPHRPEWNEEFIEQLRGVKTDMKGFRDIIKQEIYKKKESEARLDTEIAIIDALKATGEIHIGPKATEAMIEDTYKQENARMSEQGYQLKDYLNHTGKSVEDFKSETLSPIAKNRLETQAILRALESIVEAPITDEEVAKEIDMVIAEYQNETVKTRLREKLVPGDAYYEDLKSRIKSRKILDTFMTK